MSALDPYCQARSLRPGGEESGVVADDMICRELSRREAPADSGDPAVRLLQALIDDVDQRRSSVSITPST
ncbi:hypothetical protein C1I98_01655 [Spongiactinospora gelatinilytica]|uniref:Uncharacterized protein n=1 Tax=Spongiactinospora gelatinilytica TaxID=2666298 RepID=A0A2W2IDN2_9ACTN|nr:hypothetical protein [Spongiactinospora gelatinilytica]PZG56247.1 hypothetical protein C1I98_01655 [Spongiactinospora gelatinilytica]